MVYPQTDGYPSAAINRVRFGTEQLYVIIDTINAATALPLYRQQCAA